LAKNWKAAFFATFNNYTKFADSKSVHVLWYIDYIKKMRECNKSLIFLVLKCLIS